MGDLIPENNHKEIYLNLQAKKKKFEDEKNAILKKVAERFITTYDIWERLGGMSNEKIVLVKKMRPQHFQDFQYFYSFENTNIKFKWSSASRISIIIGDLIEKTYKETISKKTFFRKEKLSLSKRLELENEIIVATFNCIDLFGNERYNFFDHFTIHNYDYTFIIKDVWKIMDNQIKDMIIEKEELIEKEERDINIQNELLSDLFE